MPSSPFCNPLFKAGWVTIYSVLRAPEQCKGMHTRNENAISLLQDVGLKSESNAHPRNVFLLALVYSDIFKKSIPSSRQYFNKCFQFYPILFISLNSISNSIVCPFLQTVSLTWSPTIFEPSISWN